MTDLPMSSPALTELEGFVLTRSPRPFGISQEIKIPGPHRNPWSRA
jgi:hypothetical protein